MFDLRGFLSNWLRSHEDAAGETIGIPDRQSFVADVSGLLRHNYILEEKNGGRLLAHENARLTMGGRCVIDGEGALVIACDGAMIHGASFDVRGRNAIVVVGPKALIRNVHLTAEGPNAVILIGAGTTWEGGAAFAYPETMVSVGDDGMFSSGITVRTSDGHGIFDLSTQEQINKPADVVIGGHVWIGNGARVNKGTVIHRGSIIGQQSIVSGAVDPQCIYAGIPARKLRENIGWARTASFEEVPMDFKSPLPSYRGMPC